MSQILRNKKVCRRIVLTGGPGGGKTTAADLFRREIGDRVVVVPEAATILYSGGLIRSDNEEVRKSTQRAIYHLQRNMEDAYLELYSGRTLLCDRGTVDGMVFWPGTIHDFCDDLKSSLDDELQRYDAVVFFETAAVGGISIEGGNPTRKESLAEARKIDHALRDVWSKHPRFHFVSHETSFISKITRGLTLLQGILNQIENGKC